MGILTMCNVYPDMACLLGFFERQSGEDQHLALAICPNFVIIHPGSPPLQWKELVSTFISHWVWFYFLIHFDLFIYLHVFISSLTDLSWNKYGSRDYFYCGPLSKYVKTMCHVLSRNIQLISINVFIHFQRARHSLEISPTVYARSSLEKRNRLIQSPLSRIDICDFFSFIGHNWSA